MRGEAYPVILADARELPTTLGPRLGNGRKRHNMAAWLESRLQAERPAKAGTPTRPSNANGVLHARKYEIATGQVELRGDSLLGPGSSAAGTVGVQPGRPCAFARTR